jgi:SAM-dependent methyltransferase
MNTLLRGVARLLGRDAERFDGTPVPPAAMRCGGRNFRAAADFVATGEREARRVRDDLALPADGSLLEVGCGPGRLPLGLVRRGVPLREYCGVDVRVDAIGWARRHLTALDPRFRFVHVDVHNARYNENGRAEQSAARLPFDGRAFDVIYLYSVFSHLELADARAYLGEFERLAKPGARLFLTTFVEDDVPEFEINPHGYRATWEGALHCVRYASTFLDGLLSEHSFRLERFAHAVEADGQSAVTAVRAAV